MRSMTFRRCKTTSLMWKNTSTPTTITDPLFSRIMNREQLDQFKANYASLIVEGMDMKTLSNCDEMEQNMTHWNEEDVKEEILDYYGEETLMDLMPESVQEPTRLVNWRQLPMTTEWANEVFVKWIVFEH